MSIEDRPGGLSEERFLEQLQNCFTQLANESKKKFPHVKEACETGIIRVRNVLAAKNKNESTLKQLLINESGQFMEPFFIGCDTRCAKLIQVSLSSIQKMILYKCLNEQAAQNTINCLWNLMENGLEEVKLLQTITLLLTTNEIVIGDQLARTISMCFRLHYSKNITVSNTASATIRQSITVMLERIPEQADYRLSSLPSELDPARLFDVTPIGDGDCCRYVPLNLDTNTLDAFNLMQDLIQIINGEKTFWLRTNIEIDKSFCLELLELIIDHNPQKFLQRSNFHLSSQYQELAFLLKVKVCQLIIKLFSPNIKNRANFSLIPMLKTSVTSTSGLNNSSNTSNGTNSNQNHQQSSQMLVWSITVRSMRLISVLIRNFFEILINESEIFLSLLIRSLEADKLQWQRLTALEALYQMMIHPHILSLICSQYDMKPQSSTILRDISNSLCIFIQSQFQIVDSSTTQSLLISLVNNNRGSNSSSSSVNQSSNNAITSIACVLEITNSIIKILEKDLNLSFDFQSSSQNQSLTIDKLSSENLKIHNQMLQSTFYGLVGIYSLLLDASIDEVMTEFILAQMRKLIFIYGLYGNGLARDCLLVSICKSSLPSNYQVVPALNPDNLPFRNDYKEQNQSSSGSNPQANLSSMRIAIKNTAINLPNLLSQQNNHLQTMSSTSNWSQIESTSSPDSFDLSKQVIAVGTALANNLSLAPALGQKQQGPVMLMAKNLQCMNSLIHITITYAFVYEERSWRIVFTTLQHMVWILDIKQTSITIQQNNIDDKSSLSQPIISSDTNRSSIGNDYSHSIQHSERSTISSDLPVLSTMLSRLFECTQYNNISEHLTLVFSKTINLSDGSFMMMVRALIALSNETIESAFNNREPSLFGLIKLHEAIIFNLKRVALFWDLVIDHLIQVSSHPSTKLRECGVEALCSLVKSVLNFVCSKRKNDETEQPDSIWMENRFLAPLQQLSQNKFIDIRQKQIECLLRILQSNGEELIDGWPIIFNIIETACVPENEKLIVHSFQCYEFIVSNLLRYIPSVHIIHCINSAVAFGSQQQELNVSLSAIGLIWNEADFLFTNQNLILESIERYAKKGHKFISIDLPFCDNLTPLQSLWISLFKNLSNLCTDSRLSVRKSSVQTLIATLSKHGQSLDYKTWKAIFFYVLFPLVENVRKSSSLASNEKITRAESSKSNAFDNNSEYVIHYSRNTAFKQWCETHASIITGISRIICMKLDLLLYNTNLIDDEHQQPSTNTSTEKKIDHLYRSQNYHSSVKILLDVWSFYFDFIYFSSISNNSEVSMSAIKCFNEIIVFLSEYSKTKSNRDRNLEQTFNLIWKVAWKTWCSIGHQVCSSNRNSNESTITKNIESSSPPNLPRREKEENISPLKKSSQPLSSSTSTFKDSNLSIKPSQIFLCLLIDPLSVLLSKNISNFDER
ncbi:MON2-like protein [Sarcoptes scabiei]|uniref:MON2-like protein n=1 Tax=Sarcoptes scabiei TaxID=52283 RepID=A0A132AK42_SARSC|nr:MON2-like protein [Sarcoptes scabiei]